jgi:CMP-N,N'-diacetyllegionaminic acid synthase
MLAVIPARGGSKGLPGKNIRQLAGLPLIAHSIRFAQSCPEIQRTVVSTDSEEIAEVARLYGVGVPFLRPSELATDEAGMLPVVRHAITEIERTSSEFFSTVVLLQVTNPVRHREDLLRAIEILESDPDADGVVAVCRPDFNPRYVCVEERDGYAAPAFDKTAYKRRQDVPPVFRIVGNLYIWRRRYIVDGDVSVPPKKMKILEVSQDSAVDIDGLRDFQIAEALFANGLVAFPWLGTMERQKKI